MARRILCLGFDGATLDLIERWSAAGHLPHFQWLMERGAWGRLRSVIPPASAQGWTSFYTGKNPGKHGIFGFRKRLPHSYESDFVNRTWVQAPSLWRLLSLAGKDVIVINVPVTYPPEPVKGLLVSGMDTPGTECSFTYPPSLREEIMSLSERRYRIAAHFGGYIDSDQRRREAIETLIEMTRVRTQVALSLLRRYAWDFAMIKYDASDQVQHYFWKYLSDGEADGCGAFSDAILRIYKQLDGVIGEFESRLEAEDILAVVSDHGGGLHSDKIFYANEWLRREGLLHARSRAATAGALRGLSFLAVEKAYLLLLRWLPPDVKDILWRRWPRLRMQVRQYLKFSFIDWGRTRAYLGENLDTLYINLAGREPRGIVSPAEYETLRDKIIKGLQAVRDPETGEPVIEQVLRREEVYSGPRVAEAADLIVVPRNYSYTLSRKLRRDPKAPLVARERHHRGISGVHRLDGIVFLASAGIEPGRVLEGARIEDMAPTFLYLLNVSIPEDMDGSILEAALEPDLLCRRPPQFGPPGDEVEQPPDVYTAEQRHTITERLKTLGYIE